MRLIVFDVVAPLPQDSFVTEGGVTALWLSGGRELDGSATSEGDSNPSIDRKVW